MYDVTLSQYLIESAALFSILLTVSLAVTWVAYIRNYFALPFRHVLGPHITLKDVVVSFLIFFLIYTLATPFISLWLSLSPTLASIPILLQSLLQLIIFLLTATFFILYATLQNRQEFLKVLKQTSFPGAQPLSSDLFLGFLTWFIATPVVLTLAEFAEVITTLIFERPEAPQLAVEALKQATGHPMAFFMILLSILLFAPFLEEYLFRGLLQTWLRKTAGSLNAIFLSGFAFALLHFAPQQKWTNIPLIISLFTFGCYLGFVYEKSRSLFAPIVLHVTFNLISVIRIIFTEGNSWWGM